MDAAQGITVAEMVVKTDRTLLHSGSPSFGFLFCHWHHIAFFLRAMA
jgi:hypothetical protein